jgi:hypothetical protein
MQSGNGNQDPGLLRDYGLGEQYTNGIFGRSLRNQEICSAWVDNRRRIEQTREGLRPDQLSSHCMMVDDDEDHNFFCSKNQD